MNIFNIDELVKSNKQISAWNNDKKRKIVLAFFAVIWYENHIKSKG